MVNFSSLLLLCSSIALASAAKSSRTLKGRQADMKCWNDQWIYIPEFSKQLERACSQIGSVHVAKGDWKGAEVNGFYLLGSPTELPGTLFLSFKNTAVDYGW